MVPVLKKMTLVILNLDSFPKETVLFCSSGVGVGGSCQVWTRMTTI